MATKLTNNSVDFTFHGDRTTYSELIAKHDQDLSISKIGYIKNPQDIHRRLQKPVYSPRVIPGEGPEAKYEFNKQLGSFKVLNQVYQKNLERVEEDFGVAIGLFTRRLAQVI
jgi:hypothetical protein